jgi:predicted alpha/beta hydrolase
MKVVPFDSAVPVSALRNIAVGLLHRVEMNTSGNDWAAVVKALHLSQLEFLRMGYPKSFLVQSLSKALPGLLNRNSRWFMASAVFSLAVGCKWRPWHSLR